MIKKILILIAVIFVFLLVTDKTLYLSSRAENIGISYEEAVKSDKPFVLLFHGRTCYYCRKFMPTFEKLSNELTDNYNFVLIDTDDSKYVELYKGYNVYAIPDLMVFDTKTGKAEKVPSSMYFNYPYLKNYLLKHRYAN